VTARPSAYTENRPERLLDNFSSGGLFLGWVLITLSFAVVYWLYAGVPGNGLESLTSTDPLARFFEAIYYSVIVGTTTGLGDIAPHGISRLFTALQAIASFVLLAMFVAKFTMHRQEKVLNDIRQLSLDSSFHSIRNGLFIVRKDIDIVIARVLESRNLSKKDWMNFKAALRQMQIYIKHIPNFYSKTAKAHIFDIDHELLLIDSLERTMSRLLEGIDIFRTHDIELLSHESVMRELRALIHQIENMSLHEKQKTLDPENHEALQEILTRTEELRVHLKALG